MSPKWRFPPGSNSHTVLNKITFVEIECNASYNAFQVFDSLNGKGLDLTAADRIKNIFLMWAKTDGIAKWDTLENVIGSDYLTGFFVALFFYYKKKRISKNKLPDIFNAFYRNDAIDHFDGFYNDLYENAKIYGQLRNSNVPQIYDAIKDLSKIKMDQVFVILFAVKKYYTYLKDKDFLRFINTITTFVVRLQVASKSMNQLDSLFAKWIDEMISLNIDLDTLIQEIMTVCKNTVSDELFKDSFVNFAPSENGIAEFYLRYIENYLRKKEGERTPVERNLTVEHIIPKGIELTDWYGDNTVPDMPYSEFKDIYIESIGNKALLYGDDNSSANANDYTKKKDVYLTGKRGQNNGTPIDTFFMIKNLLSRYPDRFEHTEVMERAEALANIATNIWSCD